MFGSIIRTNKDGYVGSILKNLEMVPIDEFINIDHGFDQEMVINKTIYKFVPKNNSQK